MLLTMTAKQKALAAISALPRNTAPQEIIKVLSQIYSIKRGIAQMADANLGAMSSSQVGQRCGAA